ncbi:hypothetical protein EMIT0P100_10577 [Pseudomonas sp. IT-P100]
MFGRRDWTRTNDPHHVKVTGSRLQPIDIKGKWGVFLIPSKPADHPIRINNLALYIPTVVPLLRRPAERIPILF